MQSGVLHKHARRAGPGWARFVICCVLSAAVSGAAATGQVPATSAPTGALTPPTSTAAAPMTAENLEALFDAIIPAQLARNDIAGAVVAVVSKGQVVFTKGYGYADVATGRPASASQTLFRIGSVSKMLTWTAVMQLVEQGKIDLGADVNRYLDFHIPAAYGKPITMRHLMTHTAGFEDSYQGLWAASSADVEPLRLNRAMLIPQRIFAPGTVAAYSNYGAALAGYIVQRVSGQPFTTYVERHITGPLNMKHTTFAQPLPLALVPKMSSGYQRASAGPKPFELMQAPAGSASASAADMARFMLAHLQGGSLDGVRILHPDSAAAMQERQHAFDARTSAVGLGWATGIQNGQRLVGHDGATFYFHANLNLIPEAQAGLFVGYNSSGNGAGGTLGPVFRAFMDRYFPHPEPTIAAALSAQETDARIAGTYMPSRRGQSNLAYLVAVMGQTVVSVKDDGALALDDLMGARDPGTRWRQTAPGFWQDPSAPRRHLIFKQDAFGRWEFSDGNPVNTYHRVGWRADHRLVLGLLAFSIATCLLSLLSWPLMAWRRQRHRAARGGVSPFQRTVHVAAAINLLVWGAGAALLGFAATHLELMPGLWFARGLGVVQLGAWAGLAGTVLLAWRTAQAWRAGAAPRLARAHGALVLAACVASIWLAWQAKLLAPGLRY